MFSWMTSLRVATCTDRLPAGNIVAGHAAFEIELRLDRVISAILRVDPAGVEVSGGQNVHAAMARVAEIALVMANRAGQIGKMRILSVPGNVIARMRIEDRISVVATQAVISGVAEIAGFVRVCRRAVSVNPIEFVIGGKQFIRRQMAGAAVGLGVFARMTTHAVAHARQMRGLFGEQNRIEIRVAGGAFELRFAEMPLVAEDGTCRRDVRAEFRG